ncbi:MAG: C39 family peptidase [Candidatus Latescibacteria bacterium]|nr:C39 family peptidase [Candidatus Latescibacterota bacterium]
MGELERETLKRLLDQRLPVIVGVWTASLPYWHANRSHAVVVVGYDEQSVYLNDPKFPSAPQAVTWDEFLVAWEEFGRFGAIIRKEPFDKTG